jgi:hypothetical protein
MLHKCNSRISCCPSLFPFLPYHEQARLTETRISTIRTHFTTQVTYVRIILELSGVLFRHHLSHMTAR